MSTIGNHSTHISMAKKLGGRVGGKEFFLGEGGFKLIFLKSRRKGEKSDTNRCLNLEVLGFLNF
jgi:hypothetical protein